VFAHFGDKIGRRTALSLSILIMSAATFAIALLPTYGQVGIAAPIIASVYELSGITAGYTNAIPYSHPANLFDVTSGSNGSCPTTQWCTARAGWDGPTGLGTPNGTGAF